MHFKDNIIQQGHLLKPNMMRGCVQSVVKRKFSWMQSLREKQFVTTGLFLGAADIGATPTVACSGSSTAAAPTNGTVGAADNTSHPYKYPISSHPYKWHSRGD